MYCATPTMLGCHKLHGIFSRTEQGRVSVLHTLHASGRAHPQLVLKMPLIMKSMHIAPLAQALGPGNPCAPAQHNRLSGSPSCNATMYACSERQKAASPTDQAAGILLAWQTTEHIC